LLSLNNKSTFDNIIYNKLLHNIKKRRVFKLLFIFVEDLLKNRYIIIIIDNYTTTKQTINVDILQNSSLLLILYIFYNIDLLKTCNNIKLRISSIEFVDNINILTYNKLTKRNCKILNKIYSRFEQ